MAKHIGRDHEDGLGWLVTTNQPTREINIP